MSDDKQTVVDDTKVAAEPATEVDNAREDVDPLDKLLAEYDEGTKKPDPAFTPPETKPTPKPEPVIPDRIIQLEQRLFQEDLNEAVSNIVGDLKIPRRAALGWVDQMARENPAIQRAFMNKTQDPKSWSRFEKTLQKEIAKEFKSVEIDENATADRAAVTASIRGASTKVSADPPPKLAGMSNAAYRKHCREEYGFDPGV